MQTQSHRRASAEEEAIGSSTNERLWRGGPTGKGYSECEAFASVELNLNC